MRSECLGHPDSYKDVKKGKKGEEGGKKNRIEGADIRRRTLGSALGVESLESGRVPWVRLESVIGCIT